MAPIGQFEQIALIHLAAVFRAGVALCGQKDRAEDLVQTTFLKAFERFGSFQAGTNCKAWLLRILRNSWIDLLRRQQKMKEQTVSLAEEPAVVASVQETVWTNAQDLLNNFSDDQVIKALQSLPEEQRLTLFLVDVEQMSQDEVAQITDVAVGTVKSRTSRARTALKSSLADYAREMNLAGGEA
jgi:RNA polymerase sigma-70 factor, ECF subfamily